MNWHIELASVWAKRDSAGHEHPLICHMLDVAAAAGAVWDRGIAPSARRWFAAGLGLDEDDARGWVVCWAGLHDLGKANSSFQERRPNQSRDLPHGSVSAAVLAGRLTAPPFELDPRLARRVAVVIGGHHGVIPTTAHLNTSRMQVELDYKGGVAGWRAELLDFFGELVQPPMARPVALDNARAMWLAGLISVADWIGSNTEFFPLLGAEADLAKLDPVAYGRETATKRADQALTMLGWTARPVSTQPSSFAALFPHIHEPPNDLQQAVAELAGRLTGPALVVIEAPMGEGKTEAALMLADACGVRLGMLGHYLALPTMATSNQMFTRNNAFLIHRYGDSAAVQSQLLHGHASMSAELKALREEFASFLKRIEGVWDDDQPVGVVASGWFSARKRGLLAPFGVGTIDQVLLAALQTNHFFVRLFGLAGKTVVLDEVHAYDTYMTTLLERLLEWLASLGCTVVILSATLPLDRRNQLLTAYRRGLGEAQPGPLELRATYPRIAWVTGAEIGERELATSERGKKSVRLRWLPDASENGWQPLIKRLDTALAEGGCAAVICNTVRRAQEVYLALSRSGRFEAEAVDLFHARYRFIDRQTREERCLTAFGKPESADEPPRARRVLVATQVIEQSLDLDFDLMVSEMAPVDLLIQRSGRLHRHPRRRPARLAEAELWVIGPDPAHPAPEFERGSLVMYDEHILLRSWLALRGRETIEVPGAVSMVIEEVYGEQEVDPALSAELQTRWKATAARLHADQETERREAADRYLKWPGYAGELGKIAQMPREEEEPELHRALQAVTRLGEPTVTVSFCAGTLAAATFHEVGPVFDLLHPDDRTIAEILRHSVSLTRRGVVQELLKRQPPPAWSRHTLLRSVRPLLLDSERSATIGKTRIVLDPVLGVVYESVVNASEEGFG